MEESDHVLPILGEILRPIMQDGEDIVRAVLRVHAPFLKVIAVALQSLLEVSHFSRQYVVRVDIDEAVPVRPGMFMDKPKGMEDLVDRGHHAILETVAE